MAFTRLRAVTLSTPDPDSAAALYSRWLDYAVIERGAVSPAMAEAWGCPAAAGRAYVISRPASQAPVLFRFVQAPAVAGYEPLRTFGWAAAELCVQDVFAAHARMETSPFEIIGPPKENPSLPEILPMQVRGPFGEIVYLTEIRDDLPSLPLPRAASPIDKLFIMVLACADLEASTLWFEQALGLIRAQDMSIVYTMINAAFDLPKDTRHRLITLTNGRDVQLELDQYPAPAAARPRHSGDLPPGLAICSFVVEDLDRCRADWVAAVRPGEGALYAGGRTAVALAPDGAIVEVIEG